MSTHSAPESAPLADRRLLLVSGLAIVIALGAGVLAEALMALIGLVTNLSFYGRWSLAFTSPAGNTLGAWVIVVPVVGGLIVGVLARWGSPAIRGHGIPEVMERVLVGESRIPPRVTLLKPVGSAISIGTGGPFGAEGPIIASGGALGSLVGQALRVTADERKTLLAAGAAAGMSAVFGSPVSATLLAVELLLFEYRPRSLAPVALASAAAAGFRIAVHGPTAVFPMEFIATPSGMALAAYTVIGVLIGWLGVVITKGLYRIEDAFERLPIHWMWWPAIGGIVVGLMGYLSPRTLGVGYDNIQQLLDGSLAGQALLLLVVAKLISWSIALGSGTAGGTLAPLFTIGGGAGVLVGAGAAAVLPMLGIDPRVAGLVGMAAAFTGASRALLASVVFAFEATHQPMGLLPLLAGCTGAYLISLRTMRYTIMTERLARRGTPVITEYSADFLERLLVRDHATRAVVTLSADATVAETRAWLSGETASTHQGFPVVDSNGRLVGLLTRREIQNPEVAGDAFVRGLIRRVPIVVQGHQSLRDAADRMVQAKVGRLPVMAEDGSGRVVGIISRSDLLTAHERRLDETERVADATLWG
ncbi:MAG TPA: chloride channel protein [Gemmatimonadales bacterium]|nr:chloride channel protein [Gemmatimonadales bacterium]